MRKYLLALVQYHQTPSGLKFTILTRDFWLARAANEKEKGEPRKEPRRKVEIIQRRNKRTSRTAHRETQFSGWSGREGEWGEEGLELGVEKKRVAKEEKESLRRRGRQVMRQVELDGACADPSPWLLITCPYVCERSPFYIISSTTFNCLFLSSSSSQYFWRYQIFEWAISRTKSGNCAAHKRRQMLRRTMYTHPTDSTCSLNSAPIIMFVFFFPAFRMDRMRDKHRPSVRTFVQIRWSRGEKLDALCYW